MSSALALVRGVFRRSLDTTMTPLNSCFIWTKTCLGPVAVLGGFVFEVVPRFWLVLFGAKGSFWGKRTQSILGLQG